MDNFDSYTLHFGITSGLSMIIQLMVLLACIIIVTKIKSIGTKLLIIGSILSFVSYLGQIFIPVLMASGGTDTMMKTQVMLSYFGTFSYLFFGLGLLLFAVSDLKNKSNVSRT